MIFRVSYNGLTDLISIADNYQMEIISKPRGALGFDNTLVSVEISSSPSGAKYHIALKLVCNVCECRVTLHYSDNVWATTVTKWPIWPQHQYWLC